MSTNGSIKVSPEQQAEREKESRHNAFRHLLVVEAKDKWLDEQGVGVDVDTDARTATFFVEHFDINTTYRYGFDANGGLLLWNEEEGEERREWRAGFYGLAEATVTAAPARAESLIARVIRRLGL